MNRSLTRRSLLASVGLTAAGSGVSAATLDAQNAGTVQTPEGKRVTLLHFTDTHAQLKPIRTTSPVRTRKSR